MWQTEIYIHKMVVLSNFISWVQFEEKLGEENMFPYSYT
jgi:hypothetical protein